MKKPGYLKLVITILSMGAALASVLVIKSCKPNREGGNTKRILYINSYHPGYGSSDDIMGGIQEVVANEDILFKTCFMDTKRLAEAEFEQKVKQVLDTIRTFAPDVIIASDDNAVKYIIVPHFKDKDIPVVFCGVNWSAENYGLPATNVTGMLEVLPIEASIDTLLSYHPRANKLTVLTENSISAHKDRRYLTPIFESRGFKVHYSFSKDMASWKVQYDSVVKHADLIYFPTNGAISGWDEGEAISFMDSVGYKPIFTCDDFMMPYALIGLTKIASEQGEWAAATALRVLRGESPGQVPITSNKQVKIFINQVLAEKMKFQASESLQKSATAWQ